MQFIQAEGHVSCGMVTLLQHYKRWLIKRSANSFLWNKTMFLIVSAILIVAQVAMSCQYVHFIIYPSLQWMSLHLFYLVMSMTSFGGKHCSFKLHKICTSIIYTFVLCSDGCVRFVFNNLKYVLLPRIYIGVCLCINPCVNNHYTLIE